MTTLLTLSASDLRRAADIQERIGQLQAELTQVLGAVAEPENAAPGRRGRKGYKLSAAGLAAIRAGVRRRMGSRAATNGRGRKRWSAAAKARLAAIARARWRKVRAAGKNAL